MFTLFYEVLAKLVLLVLQNTYTGGIHPHLKPLETQISDILFHVERQIKDILFLSQVEDGWVFLNLVGLFICRMRNKVDFY